MTYIANHFERKVKLYNHCFEDSSVSQPEIIEAIETVGRLVVAFALVVLMFERQLPGVYGGLYVTVILGIDFAAIFQAYKNTREQDEVGR